MRLLRSAMTAVALCFVFAISAHAQVREFDIKASDGVTLKATFYSTGRTAPTVLLLHQCNMDRKSWQPLAGELVKRGMNVMTFDFRGYGESEGPRGPWEQVGPVLREKFPGDVDAAFAALLAQPEVDKNRIAAGGASCGVRNSIALAKRSGQIKALMLLSGNAHPQDVDYLRANPALPIFAAASSEDGNLVSAMGELVKLSSNPTSKFTGFTDAGHGVPMFGKHPELQAAIVEWLAGVLRP